MTNGKSNPKSEIRNPKQTQMKNAENHTVACVHASGFGFRHSFVVWSRPAGSFIISRLLRFYKSVTFGSRVIRQIEDGTE
jgi:hypothetical protein